MLISTRSGETVEKRWRNGTPPWRKNETMQRNARLFVHVIHFLHTTQFGAPRVEHAIAYEKNSIYIL